MLFYMVVAIAVLVAIGKWRKFGAIQWIWLVFGVSITMVVLWVLLIVFVIGPEMQRTAPMLGR